jgi:hypothetical protein
VILAESQRLPQPVPDVRRVDVLPEEAEEEPVLAAVREHTDRTGISPQSLQEIVCDDVVGSREPAFISQRGLLSQYHSLS